MFAKTVEWLMFLAIIKELSCVTRYFTLKDTRLTAIEGSCIKISCTVKNEVDDVDAHWFWIKNATWKNNSYHGTIIYSTDKTVRPVSPHFADRVTYIGSPFSGWNHPPADCSIIICNLIKTDSGNYYFRYVKEKENQMKWITEPANIMVTENPCPITFEKPPAVKESDLITLTCSTPSPCQSNVHISSKPPNSTTQSNHNTIKETFKVTWEDDGKEFSCQTQNNQDSYLIRNVSVTVEYAPKYALAEMSSKDIVEGQPVILNCSAKGNPDPTFTWFKNKEAVGLKDRVWDIPSITESGKGEYHCKATNRHGTQTSNLVIIDVKYKPEVEVMSSMDSEVTQGDTMTLTCNVIRSNPHSITYVWSKNGKTINGEKTKHYVVERIKPEDKGSYTCTASNTAGDGTSKPFEIMVNYGPRKTNITISKDGIKGDSSVGVGRAITFQCNTDANPAPHRYSWYRYKKNKQIDSLQWKSNTTDENKLVVGKVQRADEACYMCNATNNISTGEDSKPQCIQVLYAPTSLTLSMDAEVREGQLITINCSVESFPLSDLTLTMTPTSTPNSSERAFSKPVTYLPPNTLQHKFEVTSDHTGLYICTAKNSQGSAKSDQKMLVVKYSPKVVTLTAEPSLVVNENKSLTLHCSAQSHPPATSFTWMKMTDVNSKIIWRNRNFTLKNVSYSDSGWYRCTARNEMGTGDSQQVEVKVNYAPKHTEILKVADGPGSVVLNCSSHSRPPILKYSWYKENTGEKDEKVSDRQTYTVYSDQPGVYYCVAKNEINQIQSSEKIHLFNGSSMMVLIIFIFLTTLLLILTMFFIYRQKRKKSIQQGTTNTLPCFEFWGWWMGPRVRNRIHEPGTVEPFRSRDDLLPDQPRLPQAQRRQPSPDASASNSVYSFLKLPPKKQGPSAQNPVRQQGGHTQEDSLNYASLHFGKKLQNKDVKTEEEMYAIVSKQKQDKKVNFKAKIQRAARDLSSSDEEETQYSHIKI
ncbi:hypothetical protein PBY51_017434 [Eleginops maclovinus]|uniref:B-cell receptor CD22 n=1 Tax=Eleginops maclovinus TaxID=56733 RepID=A0AAN8AGM3_ELEMC|nr:hypothetical protein PBY51_017434 [Eleginops maclovinus]